MSSIYVEASECAPTFEIMRCPTQGHQTGELGFRTHVLGVTINWQRMGLISEQQLSDKLQEVCICFLAGWQWSFTSMQRQRMNSLRSCTEWERCMGKRGVAINRMSELNSVRFISGEIFDNNVAVLFRRMKGTCRRSGHSVSSPKFAEARSEARSERSMSQTRPCQSSLRPRALAEGGGGEISARIAKAVFQRPDAMAVQRASQRFRPAVASGRGAVAWLPVAAPDRFQFSRLPGARPGWSGKAGG